LVWALTGSCILASCIGLLLIRPLAMVTLVESEILAPVVICIALIGSYAIDGQIGNVVVSAVFGILGYLMLRFDYPRLTVVVALVLGGTAERSFHQAMIMGNGSWSIFVARWVSALLLTAIIILLGSPILRALYRRLRKRAILAQEPQT
jgi:putative tricarboxylic transport membrane protein